MQTLFATLMLLSWPLVALILYIRLSERKAILWTMLGAQLVLPAGVILKLPMIPQFDKNTIPSLCLLAGCTFFTPRFRFFSKFGLVELLLLVYVCEPIITSELNSDTIVVGPTVLPGVGSYDGISAAISQLLFVFPFLVGRRLLRSSADVEAILRVLVIAGLIYSVPMLFEIRMSPQLATWIYGYFPSSFGVEMRYGGFRPVVFMTNGLVVAFFTMTSVVSAAALWTTNNRTMPLAPGAITAYLGGLLVLCKAAAALIYGAALAILVRFTHPRTQLRVAFVLALLSLFYPIMRTVDIFPDRRLVELAKSISPDRADSLQVRFDQEQQLLEHASSRFLFGWGRFGRGRVYDENSGKDLTITDGRWIITFGQFGFIGFLAEFAILVFPVFRSVSALRFSGTRREAVYFSALSLIVAISVVDLLPNASLSCWTWLLAGALLGRSEALIAHKNVRVVNSSPQRIASALVPRALRES